MNRSGMKRGLAASAVTALAVTGITLGIPGSASAIGGVNFVTQQDSSVASVQNDGSNESIHLEAVGGANAAKMEFAYSTNGGADFTVIDTVARVAGPTAGTGGVFSTEFTPPASAYNTNVLVRARALSTVNTPIVGAVDLNTIYVSTTDHAVNIDNPANSALGVYQRPGDPRVNGIISGTTTDAVGGANIVVDSVTGGGANTNSDFEGDPVNGVRPWSAVVDFAGDAIESPSGNGAYALARAEDESDDVEPLRLYTQQISSGTNATVDRQLIPAGETATVTVTVLDQNNKPIAGARVRREGGPGNALTNSKGQAVFPGLLPSPAGTQYRYYVDNNDNGNYEEATEYARTFTITSYVAVASKIAATSVLGDAWDRDENPNVTISVTDQNNNGFAPQQVQYQWSVVPSDPNVATPDPYPVGTAFVANFGPNKGKANIGDVPANISGTWTLKSWIESNGNPGLNGDAISETRTFKVGQATVKWDDGTVAQDKIGTVGRVYNGVLALPDGTPLTNRTFAVVLGDQSGAENAVIAAQSAQPAGTVRSPIPLGDFSAIVTTNATTGKFGVAVSDPGGAAGSIETASLNAAAFGAFTPSTKLEIDFLDTVVAKVTLGNDAPISIFGDDRTPGRPSNLGDVVVENQYNQLLTDQDVNLTVDHGYLTPYGTTVDNLTPADTKSEGGLVGAWKHVAGDNNITVKTADGPAIVGDATRGAVRQQFAAAIDRDPGFDDDGNVTTKVTATSAGKTASDNVDFHSDNPLNAKEVKLSFSTNNVSRILPKAATYLSDGTGPIDRGVNLDLVTTDQFGNRTDDDTDLSDNSASATFGPNDNGQFTNDPKLNAQSNATTADQTITSKWVNAKKTTWHDTNPDPLITTFAATQAANPLQSDITINWYVVDPTISTYTMSHTGPAVNPVGSTVTESYKAVDQFGQPMSWRELDFFRSGPDTLQNGNPQQTTHSTRTNADGVATYVFQGTQAGNAVLAGLLYDENDQPIEQSKKTDTVVFGNGGGVVTPPSTGGVAIRVTLTAVNNKQGNDVLTARAPIQAAGATVTFYKVVNGKRVPVGTAKVGRAGYAHITVRDTNKKKSLGYTATVAATSKTKIAVSNVAGVK